MAWVMMFFSKGVMRGITVRRTAANASGGLEPKGLVPEAKAGGI